MRLILLCSVLSLCAGVLGCSTHPYVVCRGETYCTAPLTHDEAIKAAQVKKAWSDEGLYVRPAQAASATP
jgi:hypothetical protein